MLNFYRILAANKMGPGPISDKMPSFDRILAGITKNGIKKDKKWAENRKKVAGFGLK